VLSNEKLAPFLEVAPLNGELFAPLYLDATSISNRDLLEAFWHLAYYRESPSSPPRRVNYGALDVEELGSVYESLLDYHPQIDTSGTVLSFELAPGSERRSTGSYYTPPELVAELIRSALEPVMEERLKPARTREEKERAILSIRVCDPAAGSGHFLLAAARRLGKELARIRTGEDEPAPERVREAIRDVVAHCIYGVDKNPLAVELCRVALWLEAHCEGKPLTFLDNRIRCGDSLVGVLDLDVLKAGIPDDAFAPVSTDAKTTAAFLKKRNRSERRDLEHGQIRIPFAPTNVIADLGEKSHDIESIADDSPPAIREKKSRYDRLLADPERLRIANACDLWTAAFFQRFTPELATSPPAITTDAVTDQLAGRAHRQALAAAQALVQRQRYFHWPLEFPEVFVAGGFDAVIGNPPFMGGLKISGSLGDKYRHWLEVAFEPYGGTADLCAAFYRRAYSLLKPGGRMGMVATNTIGQGDTRESGLAVILREGGTITFARRFIKWPGAANVEVNLVAICKRAASSEQRAVLPILDGQPVAFISSRLDAEPEAEPTRLPQNEGKAFIGDTVVGIGFVLEPEEAEALIARDPRNADCLFPYLNGDDLNSHPDQEPSRWVICFHDWDLERAKQYPDLLRIVEERVKPQRSSLPPHNATNRKRREYWWQLGVYAQNMRRAIAPLRRVLVRSRVSELHMLAFVPKGYVYGDATVVFAFDDDYHFALLQSGVHEVWVWRNASSLESRNRYTPTDCFDTFPFPPEAKQNIAAHALSATSQPAQTPSDYLDDAAVVCLLLDELLQRQRPADEFTVQKHAFVAKEKLSIRLRSQFERKAAGPWSHDLLHRAIYAAQKRNWLRWGKNRLVPAGSFYKGVEHARMFLGDKAARLAELVQDLQGFGRSGLERWTTVLKIVSDLRMQRRPITLDAIQGEVDAWPEKRMKDLFTEESVQYTVRQMIKQGWIQLDEAKPSVSPHQEAARLGAEYHEHRRQIMLSRNLGLTKTYNLFHNPACQDADIVRLRELHAEMDRAILACYGWEDLAPNHNFYQNDRGQTRYTISPEARREVLVRLLMLNLKEGA